MGDTLSQVAFPVPPLDAKACEQLLSRRDLVWIQTAETEAIPAVLVRNRADRAPDARERWAIIYSHMNASDLARNVPYLERLSEATGVDVFGYEYFGYSVAPGQPSEAGCARCIDAAYAHLVRERRYRPERVVLFGRSIGSVPTVDLAARCDRGGLGGVVLQVRERARHPQSPFPSSPNASRSLTTARRPRRAAVGAHVGRARALWRPGEPRVRPGRRLPQSRQGPRVARAARAPPTRAYDPSPPRPPRLPRPPSSSLVSPASSATSTPQRSRASSAASS